MSASRLGYSRTLTGRWGFHMKYQRGKSWPGSSRRSTAQQQCDLGSDFLPLSLNFLITNVQTLTSTSWGCQATSPSLGPRDVSIGSSDMHYDHTVAKTPEERGGTACVPPFSWPRRARSSQKVTHLTSFNIFLDLDFFPGLVEKADTPSPKPCPSVSPTRWPSTSTSPAWIEASHRPKG